MCWIAPQSKEPCFACAEGPRRQASIDAFEFAAERSSRVSQWVGISGVLEVVGVFVGSEMIEGRGDKVPQAADRAPQISSERASSSAWTISIGLRAGQ